MAFYVSIRDDSRYVLALGPFNRHGDALRAVGHVHRLADTRYPLHAPFLGFGTCHVRRGPLRPGVLNRDLGLPPGRIAESPLPPCRW